MKNILFVSLNSGGTKGHHVLIQKVTHKLKHDFSIFEVSDSNSKNSIQGVISLKIPQQKHSFSTGGAITYTYGEDLLYIIKQYNIQVVIFSTFFDPLLVKIISSKKVQTIFISYPLRDSHRESLIVRDTFQYFNRLIWLSDINPDFEIYSDKEIFASPISQKDALCKNKTTRILISCGGAGRPSRKKFYSIISEIINNPHMNKFDFTIIDPYDEIKFIPPNCTKFNWSNNFQELLLESSFVISEAGYHTISELISMEKPAIIIPGARRIDNQELRAVYFEKLGCGKFLFPEEDSEKLIQLIMQMKNNKDNYTFDKAKAEMYKHESVDIVLRKEVQ